jgi:hypothetical protein
MAEERSVPKLIAYRIHKSPSMPIVPAAAMREWMDKTHERFAYRCLPLLIANQCGWFVLNTHKLKVVWNGKNDKDAVTIICKSGPRNTNVPAVSHFGYGVLTWNLNYLFRTPPGWNLWARGPANLPKDGIVALDGIIETDWSVATFTMNWKMTTVDVPVEFEIGEPICFITPVRRGEAESFEPVLKEITDEPELKTAFDGWSTNRSKFNSDLEHGKEEALQKKWQKDYVQGVGPGGITAPQHQTKLAIKEFSGTEGKFQNLPRP